MNAILKRLKSKTYWAALISAVLTIIEAKEQVIGGLVPEEYRPLMPLIFPLLMMLMREITTTALAEK